MSHIMWFSGFKGRGREDIIKGGVLVDYFITRIIIVTLLQILQFYRWSASNPTLLFHLSSLFKLHVST